MRLPSTTLSIIAGLVALVGADDLAWTKGGTHSDVFDAQKYSLLDRLLVTPRTHPHLFSVRPLSQREWWEASTQNSCIGSLRADGYAHQPRTPMRRRTTRRCGRATR